MIEMIIGAKGSGKTKKIIDLANDTAENGKGMAVYLSVSARNRMEIKNNIRFIDVREEKIETADGLSGFIKGMLNANYDIEYVFIDGVYKMLNDTIGGESVAKFMASLDEISQKTDVHFVMTVSADKENLPACFENYKTI